MSDLVAVAAVAGLATSVMTLATGATILARFNSDRKKAAKNSEQVAVAKGRDQGLRDAEVSALRSTVDYHEAKIGEIDDWKQETSKTLVQLLTDVGWMRKAVERLEAGVDELRRRQA